MRVSPVAVWLVALLLALSAGAHVSVYLLAAEIHDDAGRVVRTLRALEFLQETQMGTLTIEWQNNDPDTVVAGVDAEPTVKDGALRYVVGGEVNVVNWSLVKRFTFVPDPE